MIDTIADDMGEVEKTDKPLAPPTPPGLDSTNPVGQVTHDLVLTKDGFPLFPQPVLGDELDPLNWSWVQKHTILAIVMSL